MRQLPVILASLISYSLFGQTYIINTFAGGGLPTNVSGLSASIGLISGLAVDPLGNVFVVSRQAQAVLRLDARTGFIAVIAGNGTPGFSGDNGPATDAQINMNFGTNSIAVDANSNLYIADENNNRIRRVSNGIITTVAGTGVFGFSGDGGPASSARLYAPVSVAVDPVGNVYIADTNNNRVRKVSNGIITTVAGTGAFAFSGDGGPALSAALDGPGSVAVDPDGNVYIVDVGNSRIRRVSNGTITTVAGTGTSGFSGDNGPAINAQLNGPSGISVGTDGNLYIADFYNYRVRRVSNGTITTVAGTGTSGFSGDNGPAINAQIGAPSQTGFDAVGNLYIGENSEHIRKVSNGVINTIAGNGTYFAGDNGRATSAELYFPADVAADSAGTLYIADFFNERVRKVSNGIITTVAGNGMSAFVVGNNGDNGPATSAPVAVGGVGVDSSGVLFVTDVNSIRRVSNGIITTVVGNGTSGFGGDGGPALSAQLQNPTRVAIDQAGNLYIVDNLNYRIRKVSNGIITTVAGNGTSGFSGDGGPATAAQLKFGNSGIAVDSNENLYIADYTNCRLRKVSNGIISTIAGTGTCGFSGDGGPALNAQLGPAGAVAVDSAGNLLILDAGNGRVRKISNGVISTIAGGGASFGDGGPALNAQLSAGYGLTIDAVGNIYVADTNNNRIRILTPSGVSGGINPPSIGAVTNAASNLTGSIAPGEIVTIKGSGMGPLQIVSAHVGTDGLYDPQLAGTVVQFNGIAAPMIYTSATQVAAIVPYEITGTGAQVAVIYQGQTSTTTSVLVAPSAPGVFTLDSTGQGQAAAINQSGSINTASAPAPIGSIISIYATGEGQTTPTGVDGKPVTVPLPKPNLPVNVTIGGQTVSGAQLQYAGGAPDQVAGLLQVNVQIPSGVTPGNAVPIVLSVGGKNSQASVTLAVSAAAGSQALAVTSLSTVSPTPLTPLYIGTVGLNMTAPVAIQFSNNSGFSFTEQPIRIAADGTVVAAVPLFYDPSTYKVGSGTVSMVLTQGSQSTGPISVAIQNLPSVSSYGTKPGQISHAFLVYEALLIGRRLNELQAYQVIPGNKVDTSQAQTSLRALLNSFIEARSDVDYVSANQSLVISGGTHSNGFPIQFDQNSLDLMDRIIGQHLSQIATVVSSVTQLASLPSGATPRLPARLPKGDDRIGLKVKAEPSSTTNPNMATVLNVIDGATNQIALEQAISDSQDQDGTWVDKILAAAGGVGSLYNQVTLGTEGSQATAGTEFGAVVSAVSLINNVVMESYDLGLVALAPDSPKANQAANDLYKRANDSTYAAINVELGLLTLANPEFLNLNQFAGASLKSLALVSAVEQCYSTSCYSNLDTSSLQLAAETPTILSSSTLGFGIVDGTAQIPYSSGMVSPGQNEVQVSSNGVMFSGIADENGAFQLFVPLQADPFTYATADLQIVDPITQNTLNTIDLSTGKADSLQVVDLSRLTTQAPLVLPTIKVLTDCSDSEDTCFKQCTAIWDADNTLQGVENEGTCVLRCQAGFNSCSAAQAGTGVPALLAGLSRPRIATCSPRSADLHSDSLSRKGHLR